VNICNDELTIIELYVNAISNNINIIVNNISGFSSLLHLDAKYKLPSDHDSFNSEDLNKMHAYKEGIIGTKGAFILTLGRKKSSFYKPLQLNDLNRSFPSV
jgi:hypothetical protein